MALSRESWRFILAETDDEAEWIPSPRQKNAVIPGAPVTQQTVDGWMVFLANSTPSSGQETGAALAACQGHQLPPRLPGTPAFDPVLWAQGSAALPYLEDGPMTERQTWNQIMGMFERRLPRLRGLVQLSPGGRGR